MLCQTQSLIPSATHPPRQARLSEGVSIASSSLPISSLLHTVSYSYRRSACTSWWGLIISKVLFKTSFIIDRCEWERNSSRPLYKETSWISSSPVFILLHIVILITACNVTNIIFFGYILIHRNQNTGAITFSSSASSCESKELPGWQVISILIYSVNFLIY